MLVGNRAGVVEWTSVAFSRLTGFPLGETLDKPITHFLERAGLEIDLVEFVGDHFLEGRACTVEMPFETFDGRSIHVHLEVEPLRQSGDGEDGEITRFIAVASEVIDRKDAKAVIPSPVATGREPCPALERIERSGRAAPFPLAEFVSRIGRRFSAKHSSEVLFEIVLEPELMNVAADADQMQLMLEGLLEASLSDADHRPICVTALAGVLVAGRSYISRAHPIPARSIPGAEEPRIYLEIHDTSPHLAADVWSRIQSGEPGRTQREHALTRAAEKADRLGLTFHLDSTPGCGTQVLLLMPASVLGNPG